MSAEHIVTENIWEGDTVGVQGLPWCRQVPKFIRKESFTSNILCTTHNNALSPVDDEGIAAFRHCRDLSRIHFQRAELLKAGQWAGRFDTVEYHVDGPKLERWFLKTLINMEVVGKQGMRIGPEGGTTLPSKELVEVAFGLRLWKAGMGLYFCGIGGVPECADIQEERLKYLSFIRDSPRGSYIAAGEFWFHGWDFFLCLEPEGMPEVLRLGDRPVRPIHRPAELELKVDGRSSQRITFRWQSG